MKNKKFKTKSGFTPTLAFTKQRSCVPLAYCKSKCRGFTIIETMVSVGLFTVIAVSGMGALLNANSLHQKSGDMRSVIDSLSFIVEDMSRNIRTGYNYRCLAQDDPMTNLTARLSGSNCKGIAFESADGNPDDDGDQWVYIIGTRTIGGDSIEGIFKSTDSSTTFVALNPEEININVVSSSFSILGAEEPLGDKQQPLVVMKLIGDATSKGIVSPFSLQTAATQRTIDVTSGI